MSSAATSAAQLSQASHAHRSRERASSVPQRRVASSAIAARRLPAVAASVLTDMEPFTRWTLALIAGGGVAGSVQGLTTVARGLSTATTGGLANPILATGEAVGAGTFALLAILVPLLAAALALLLAFWVRRRLFRRRAPQSA